MSAEIPHHGGFRPAYCTECAEWVAPDAHECTDENISEMPRRISGVPP